MSQPEEVRALRDLYVATGGANWRNSRHWDFESSASVASSSSSSSVDIYVTSPAPTLVSLSDWHGIDENDGMVISESTNSLSSCNSLPSTPVRPDKRKAMNTTSSNGHYTSVESAFLSSRLEELSPPQVQFKNVTKVRLIMNNLCGPLPDSMRSLRHLQYLDLSNNYITGSFPHWVAELSSLQDLRLHYNRLSGDLRRDVFIAMPNLSRLQLEGNELTGEIPDTLLTLPYILKINLSNNHFRGELPDVFVGGSQIRELKLRNNQLEGRLPRSIGKVENLKGLYLNNNLFSGPVPLEICQLKRLQYLWLNNNNLSGTLPLKLYQTKSLTELRVEQNRSLYGPQSLAGLKLLHWWRNALFYLMLVFALLSLLVLNKKYNGGFFLQEKDTPIFDFFMFTSIGMLRRGLEATGLLPLDFNAFLIFISDCMSQFADAVSRYFI